MYQWGIALEILMHFMALVIFIDLILGNNNKLSFIITLIGASLLVGSNLALFVSYFNTPHFGTDGLLFARYAIDLLLQGKDPYAYSMSPAFEIYGLDERWTTPTVSGGIVDRFSYPPLGFLIFLPLYLLGIPDLNATTLLFFILTIIFLSYEAKRFWLLPILLAFLDPNLFLFTVGGVYDIIWVFFLLIAMKYFYKGKLALSAVFIGIAISIKQTPVIIIPFLLIYLLKKYNLATTLKTLAVLISTFLIISLPFLLWNPQAYIEGVVAPGKAIPLGMGLVSLFYAGWINVPTTFFALTMLVVFISLILIYIIIFNRVKDLLWLTSPLVLWFYTRSLQNYFISFIPVVAYILIIQWRQKRLLGDDGR